MSAVNNNNNNPTQTNTLPPFRGNRSNGVIPSFIIDTRFPQSAAKTTPTTDTQSSFSSSAFHPNNTALLIQPLSSFLLGISTDYLKILKETVTEFITEKTEELTKIQDFQKKQKENNSSNKSEKIAAPSSLNDDKNLTRQIELMKAFSDVFHRSQDKDHQKTLSEFSKAEADCVFAFFTKKITQNSTLQEDTLTASLKEKKQKLNNLKKTLYFAQVLQSHDPVLIGEKKTFLDNLSSELTQKNEELNQKANLASQLILSKKKHVPPNANELIKLIGKIEEKIAIARIEYEKIRTASDENTKKINVIKENISFLENEIQKEESPLNRDLKLRRKALEVGRSAIALFSKDCNSSATNLNLTSSFTTSSAATTKLISILPRKPLPLPTTILQTLEKVNATSSQASIASHSKKRKVDKHDTKPTNPSKKQKIEAETDNSEDQIEDEIEESDPKEHEKSSASSASSSSKTSAKRGRKNKFSLKPVLSSSSSTAQKPLG